MENDIDLNNTKGQDQIDQDYKKLFGQAEATGGVRTSNIWLAWGIPIAILLIISLVIMKYHLRHH